VRGVQEAVRQATEAVRSNQPGLFTALIIDANSGALLATGRNEVLIRCDPTAHAEIVAIREACFTTKSIRLDAAVLCCNAEPCPMCLAAAYWAGIRGVYYACSKEQVASLVGFDDARLYEDLARNPQERTLMRTTLVKLDGGDECDPTEAFTLWKERETSHPTDASAVSPSAHAASSH